MFRNLECTLVCHPKDQPKHKSANKYLNNTIANDVRGQFYTVSQKKRPTFGLLQL